MSSGTDLDLGPDLVLDLGLALEVEPEAQLATGIERYFGPDPGFDQDLGHLVVDCVRDYDL
ncbi:hypothetical protein [Celeribacter sp.]|uniref:hypothetical protein n=1 Tax=Celeribacter sp. TaxID=1890673 RepID=UPI003A92C7A9